MGAASTAVYQLVPVDLPPEMPTNGKKTRVSALTQKIHDAAATPGQWFSIAIYQSRTGAHQAAQRIRNKDWPWPVVPYAVVRRTQEGTTGSELYVKVLELPQT
jgi:hypothetical protein